MSLYSVAVDVEFQIKATSRAVVANRNRTMLCPGKFEETNL